MKLDLSYCIKGGQPKLGNKLGPTHDYQSQTPNIAAAKPGISCKMYS